MKTKRTWARGRYEAIHERCGLTSIHRRYNAPWHSVHSWLIWPKLIESVPATRRRSEVNTSIFIGKNQQRANIWEHGSLRSSRIHRLRLRNWQGSSKISIWLYNQSQSNADTLDIKLALYCITQPNRKWIQHCRCRRSKNNLVIITSKWTQNTHEKRTNLRIDNKPSTKFHNGEIIQNSNNKLHLLMDNKGASIYHTVTGRHKEKKT